MDRKSNWSGYYQNNDSLQQLQRKMAIERDELRRMVVENERLKQRLEMRGKSPSRARSNHNNNNENDDIVLPKDQTIQKIHPKMEF